eukprot:2565905-Pleurochrysis_carterae.AAC.1
MATYQESNGKSQHYVQAYRNKQSLIVERFARKLAQPFVHQQACDGDEPVLPLNLACDVRYPAAKGVKAMVLDAATLGGVARESSAAAV